MKLLIALISVLALTGVFLFTQSGQQQALQDSTPEATIFKAYQAWKSQHSQNFNSSEDEYRFSEFKTNYLFAQKHNASNKSLTLAMTQFAAMSNEEFKLTTLLQSKVQSNKTGVQFQKSGAAVPESIDWVSKGAVYKTQNQGSCGSCWSFATIGGLQGLRYIVDGVLELLSAQQITSCVAKEFLDDKTQGCGGGEAQYAYAYTAENGIETEASYPYVNGAGGVAKPCAYNKSKVVFTNKGVGFVAQDDTDAMKEALLQQPLSIAVDAGSIFFQLYSTGIIESTNCGIELNHAILLVGYNTAGEKPYWTVQNSWGSGWGSKGFGSILISEGNGICGINMQVDYPTDVNQ